MQGPRRRFPTVVAWVVVATLLPAAALGWLGWRVIDQDRALERQRVQDFLASTANRVTADIERDLGTIERTLGSAGKAVAGPVDSATMVRVDRNGRQTVIEGAALAYALTVEAAATEPPDSLWRDAERLDFADHDLAAAARMYRELARSTDRNVRAGALIRLASTLTRAAQPDEALRAYADLQPLDRATINGDPADLFARWARAELLVTLNRLNSFPDETASLDADYLRGRWRLDRTTALFYAEVLRRWRSDADDEKLARRIALTDAVAATWQGWRSAGVTTAPDSGRRSIRAGATEILTLARETDDGLVVFAATPLYLSYMGTVVGAAERRGLAPRWGWTTAGRLEFYLAPDARGRAFELFEGLLDASGVRLFAAQTSNSVYAAMVHTYGRDISSGSIVFRDGLQTSLPSLGATMKRVTSENESLECFRRREGGSEWTLELDGRTVASGGVLFHYNHPYGDIYMEAAEDCRRRGLGAYLVQELKRATYEMGGIPAARCSPNNVASRRTLQKAGLVPYAHLLNGTFTSPSTAGS